MFGFGSLRFRASARKHASASTLPRLGGKAASCILGFVGIPAMNPPLITAEQPVQLLAVGEARAAGQSIDPLPAVRLFTPDAHVTWQLAALDPADGDTAWGLIDLGIGLHAPGTAELSDLTSSVGPSQHPVRGDR